jgi:hypothetical protein
VRLFLSAKIAGCERIFSPFTIIIEEKSFSSTAKNFMKLPKQKTDNIVVQHLDKEILIYDLKTHYQLTEDLIFFALDELRKVNLLADDAGCQTPFANMTRREAVRKIGFASLVALPVVSMIVAPSAAHAASAFPPGSRTFRQSCTTSTQCAAGAPNCTNTPLNSAQRICCVGSVSYYDTGGIVNSCSGGACSAATFACQADANRFCCSGVAQASCSAVDTCACRCL